MNEIRPIVHGQIVLASSDELGYSEIKRQANNDWETMTQKVVFTCLGCAAANQKTVSAEAAGLIASLMLRLIQRPVTLTHQRIDRDGRVAGLCDADTDGQNFELL